MFLNNVGIFVKDLEKAKTFFEDYFGARVWKEFNSPEQNYYSYVLEFDGQARLELMSKPGIVDQPKDPNRSGLAHVCFAVQSREQLDDIIARFKKEGFTIQYEPSSPTGSGEVRAVTFEDIVLEVNYTEA